MLFLLHSISLLSASCSWPSSDDSDTERNQCRHRGYVRRNLVDSLFSSEESIDGSVQRHTVRISNHNKKFLQDREVKKCTFIHKIEKHIHSNIDSLWEKIEVKNSSRIIRNTLDIIVDHFFGSGKEKIDEMCIFLANAFHNTSYLKIFLSQDLIEERVGTEVSRGLLQIFGEYNYMIANGYSGKTNFRNYPEKMAYLTTDSINATLFFWDNLVAEIKRDGQKVDFYSVLKKLNPTEIQNNNYKKIKICDERLRHRKYIYTIVKNIANEIW